MKQEAQQTEIAEAASYITLQGNSILSALPMGEITLYSVWIIGCHIPPDLLQDGISFPEEAVSSIPRQRTQGTGPMKYGEKSKDTEVLALSTPGYKPDLPGSGW